MTNKGHIYLAAVTTLIFAMFFGSSALAVFAGYGFFHHLSCALNGRTPV